jgi:hypothetical protein
MSSPDIFVFCLSTRAGGLGINLTAADTVIFCTSVLLALCSLYSLLPILQPRRLTLFSCSSLVQDQGYVLMNR